MPCAAAEFRRVLMGLACFGLAGCNLGSYGKSAPYHYSVLDPVAVQMPANAPSVMQQFRPAPQGQVRKTSGEHPGIDIYQARGTPVLAAAPGTVTAAFRDPSYGNRVVLRHGTGPQGYPIQTVYKHLDSRTVRVGQTLKRGQPLGTLGHTGLLAAGIDHLHFEVHQIRPARSIPRDPHLYWAKGPGRVTCPGHRHTGTGLTYPLPCK